MAGLKLRHDFDCACGTWFHSGSLYDTKRRLGEPSSTQALRGTGGKVMVWLVAAAFIVFYDSYQTKDKQIPKALAV